MRLTYLSSWRTVASLSLILLVQASSPIDDNPHAVETIDRDVCIVGGGSSGTYAAVHLRDQGKSVVVVEQSDHLGGHAETAYFDNGKYIEYGVMGVFNNKLSRDYFTRIGAAYKPLNPAALKKDFIDFKTGQRLPSDAGNSAGFEAILKYSAIIEKYGLLKEGVYNLPRPIPEELLQPFENFVKRHDLEDALELIFTFVSSVGDLLQTPLLYVLQNFGIAHVNALHQGYIAPTQGFSKLYEGAATIIGLDNILYKTTVVDSCRSDADGVSVIVTSQVNGKKTRIKAKKLLITMPPTAEAMAPFDLDTSERKLFEKWKWKTYYASIINQTVIPDALDIVNLDPAQPNHLPKPPFQWALQWMGVPGHLASKLVADADFTAQDAKDLILSDLRRFKNAYLGAIREPNIVAFTDHTPTSLTVAVEDIKNGFYDRLYTLQGRRSTFYTGRSFCSDYSSLLWAYTDTVLEQMLL